MDIARYNRTAWDQQVKDGNRWTVPVSSETIAAARDGDWSIVLTPQIPVPQSWFPPLSGLKVLCLASGGGQQAPILAAAGARVTVWDNSPRQLEQDAAVALRDGLPLDTIEGDMRDLSGLDADSFDLVFNPCSVSFVPELESVFTQIHRVLRVGGKLMAGFINPALFLFDEKQHEAGNLVVRHALPYSDMTHLTDAEKDELMANREPLMFSHSLEDIIAGQLRGGLVLRDLYEDTSPGDAASQYLPLYFATLAEKA